MVACGEKVEWGEKGAPPAREEATLDEDDEWGVSGGGAEPVAEEGMAAGRC